MRIYGERLINLKEMLITARKNHYAVGHFNINNLEWTKSLIKVAKDTNTPIILGVSEGAAKYMGGYKTVVAMVNGLLEFFNVTKGVVLHLDHGQSFEAVEQAIKAGFSSVMFDGSHLDSEDNFEKTKKVVEFAKKYNVSVEAEVGSIGGEEDGVVSSGELANIPSTKKMVSLGIDILAAGFGNIHGKYPANWKGLSFDVLQEISTITSLPLVLHGGSGIPFDQIAKAIKLGISKVNVNTECQLAFCRATKAYFEKGMQKEPKGYDPRKILAPGSLAIKETFVELTKNFGCYNKLK